MTEKTANNIIRIGHKILGEIGYKILWNIVAVPWVLFAIIWGVGEELVIMYNKWRSDEDNVVQLEGDEKRCQRSSKNIIIRRVQA